MRKTWKWVVIAGLGLGICALLIGAFVKHHPDTDDEGDDHPIEAPSRVTRNAAGESVIRLDQATQSRIGLAVETLAAASQRPAFVAYGQLEVDPSRSFVVRAPVPGTLRRPTDSRWPDIGEILANNTVVGTIEPRIQPVDRVNLADRLTTARADMEASRASSAAAKAAYERARILNADNKNVSDQALQEAEARMKMEQAQLAAATQSVRLIQTSLKAATGAAGPSPLRVERGGQVVEILTQPGESVEAGQPILRVTRFDSLLARVDLPAGESLGPAVVSAEILPIGRDDHPIRARQIALAAMIDPKTQGEPYLFRVPNPNRSLRPGLAVTAYLNAPGPPTAGVILPRAAVLHYLGKAWTYVQTAPNQFTRREVSLGQVKPSGWFTSSLAGGDRVVVTGAQTLLSDELKSQIQADEDD